MDSSNTDGAPGGVYTIGSRSITIWSWDGTNDLVRVWDSGSKFEMITGGGDVTITPEDLCGPCLANGGSDCDDCPFNSDRAPPSFERRSDNKGPEPESVTVATLDDGTRLVFTGLERTGGIVTYDITDPTAPVYQDFLNVRNWKVNDPSIYDDAYYYLNDGPEHLVYVQPSDSPIGQPLLLAAHPYYGRFSIYMIESGDARTSDGSCSSTATCGYIPTSLGGTGALLPDICDIVTSAYESTFNCESSSSGDDSTLAIAIAVPLAIVLLIAGGIAAYCAFSMGKQSGWEKAKELKEQEFALKGDSASKGNAASVKPAFV